MDTTASGLDGFDYQFISLCVAGAFFVQVIRHEIRFHFPAPFDLVCANKKTLTAKTSTLLLG